MGVTMYRLTFTRRQKKIPEKSLRSVKQQAFLTYICTHLQRLRVNLTLTMSSSSFVAACCFSSLVLSWEQICDTERKSPYIRDAMFELQDALQSDVSKLWSQGQLRPPQSLITCRSTHNLRTLIHYSD